MTKNSTKLKLTKGIQSLNYSGGPESGSKDYWVCTSVCKLPVLADTRVRVIPELFSSGTRARIRVFEKIVFNQLIWAFALIFIY